jgi:hypothetical protein
VLNEAIITWLRNDGSDLYRIKTIFAMTDLDGGERSANDEALCQIRLADRT